MYSISVSCTCQKKPEKQRRVNERPSCSNRRLFANTSLLRARCDCPCWEPPGRQPNREMRRQRFRKDPWSGPADVILGQNGNGGGRSESFSAFLEKTRPVIVINFSRGISPRSIWFVPPSGSPTCSQGGGPKQGRGASDRWWKRGVGRKEVRLRQPALRAQASMTVIHKRTRFPRGSAVHGDLRRNFQDICKQPGKEGF